MKTITINLPNTVYIDDKEALMTIASRLYEKGKLSLSRWTIEKNIYGNPGKLWGFSFQLSFF